MEESHTVSSAAKRSDWVTTATLPPVLISASRMGCSKVRL